jgi:hypothetical protein
MKKVIEIDVTVNEDGVDGTLRISVDGDALRFELVVEGDDDTVDFSCDPSEITDALEALELVDPAD